MTLKKPTAEQVNKHNEWAMKSSKGDTTMGYVKTHNNKTLQIRMDTNTRGYFVNVQQHGYGFLWERIFEDPYEAIAYAEDLLKRQYRWLPQQQKWFMSGEFYNLANGGTNKVFELIHLYEEIYGDIERCGDWYYSNIFEEPCGPTTFNGLPSVAQLNQGITVHFDSPILKALEQV